MIENDYFGMAQDMRRMKNKFREGEYYGFFIITPERMDFLDNLIEFEDYCLDQEYRLADEENNYEEIN